VPPTKRYGIDLAGHGLKKLTIKAFVSKTPSVYLTKRVCTPDEPINKEPLFAIKGVMNILHCRNFNFTICSAIRLIDWRSIRSVFVFSFFMGTREQTFSQRVIYTSISSKPSFSAALARFRSKETKGN